MYTQARNPTAEEQIAFKIKGFCTYAQEREMIRIKREVGLPKPWTDDEILRSYRFCNVFREDDTVTKWIAANVRTRFALNVELPALLALCRWVNQIETLEEIFSEVDVIDDLMNGLKLTQAVIRRRMDAGLSTWTGAYMIRAESNRSAEWYDWPKERYICEKVVLPVLRICRQHEVKLDIVPNVHPDKSKIGDILSLCTSIESATAWLASLYGWGHFMAYEVATDLAHTIWLGGSPDRFTWANAGPGAVRGLNRIFGRELTASVKEPQSLNEMRSLMEPLAFAIQALYKQVHGLTAPFQRHQVDMRAVEHTLCEFDKYERVRLGQGRPRQKYNGGVI